MYLTRNPHPSGLGLPWVIPIIAAVAGTIGSAAAARLISGPSSPSQKDIEEQLKLQQRLEVERMVLAQRQAMEAAAFQQQLQQQQMQSFLPIAAVLGLALLLR